MGPTPNSEPQRASERAAAIPGSVGNTAILSISAEATWPKRENLEGNWLVHEWSEDSPCSLGGYCSHTCPMCHVGQIFDCSGLASDEQCLVAVRRPSMAPGFRRSCGWMACCPILEAGKRAGTPRRCCSSACPRAGRNTSTGQFRSVSTACHARSGLMIWTNARAGDSCIEPDFLAIADDDSLEEYLHWFGERSKGRGDGSLRCKSKGPRYHTIVNNMDHHLDIGQ